MAARRYNPCVRRRPGALAAAVLVVLAVLLAWGALAVPAPSAFAEEGTSSSQATSPKASSALSSSSAAQAGSSAAETDAPSAAQAQETQAQTQGDAQEGDQEGAQGGTQEGAQQEGSSRQSSVAAPKPVDNPANIVNPHQTPDNSFLYDTSIDELTNADASFQGNVVQVMGEVVGDSLAAEEDPGKHWITLETLEADRASSISVLIDDEYLGLTDSYGNYHTVGTILQVRGTYYLTCPSHEGIMDIHADTVVLVSAGSVIEERLDVSKFIPGVLLVVFGLALTVLFNHLREREL